MKKTSIRSPERHGHDNHRNGYERCRVVPTQIVEHSAQHASGGQGAYGSQADANNGKQESLS